jgi:uncharacterized membrane protein YdcZ (DUF606 family)
MEFMILGAMLAGGFVAARSGLDARLGKELPAPALAAIASGVVAAMTVLLYVLATRTPLPSASQITAVPAWCWAGGIASGGGLVLVIPLTPRLGIATVSAWVTAGQMVFSLAADQGAGSGST